MSGILGLIGAFAVVILGSLVDGDPLSALFSLTAAIIVLGGTFIALFTQFGPGGFLAGIGRCVWLVKPPQIDLLAFIDQVSAWSSQARAQGVLALEEELKSVSDPFQRQGLQMVVDNTRPDELEATLNILAAKAARADQIAGELWEAAGGYSPTIGVMGAVLGLIHVMMRLDHPEELGAGIATAFVATIYGVGGANLLFLPLGTRFANVAAELERDRHVVIQGFKLLAEGKPGIVIRQTLQNFITIKPAKPAMSGGPAAEPAAEPG